MNLVKIVNQYIDTDNSETILQGEDGKYYGLHQELSGCTSYKEIKETADILTIDRHLNLILPEETLLTFVRDMHTKCERLLSQYDGENLLHLLLAAAYIGKAEGINENIAKHNEQFKSEQ